MQIVISNSQIHYLLENAQYKAHFQIEIDIRNKMQTPVFSLVKQQIIEAQSYQETISESIFHLIRIECDIPPGTYTAFLKVQDHYRCPGSA
jgi:hypothetical protein